MSTNADEPPFSVPRYSDGQPCLQASDHLLVTQDDGAAATARLATELCRAPHHLALTEHAGPAELQAKLLIHLRDANVGLRLYLQGDEAFIWPLHALARVAGLQEDEIVLMGQCSAQRRIYCVHCSTTQPGTAQDHLTCAQCGVALEIRRHFSRRLGAYLGVCADADQPYAEVRP